MSLPDGPKKIAFSHDWLNGMRGGEKCLEALSDLYPDAAIHTLFCDPQRVSEKLLRHRIKTSFLQSWPMRKTHYRYYLPLFPKAMETLHPGAHELLISTSHCVAKGLRKSKDALHICYCFTPMRYAWGFFDEYFGKRNIMSKALVRAALKRLKNWDLEANAQVDYFVTISKHVQKRVRNCYDVESEVVYPPVDTDFYSPAGAREGNYLVVSALVPYKRVDLAVQAFNQLQKKLIIVGDGPEMKTLVKMAQKNIRFLGWQSDENLREHYRRAKALIFPGEEDFGIIPVEAQACGCPVIAYKNGGVLETVVEGLTGSFFDGQTPESLAETVARFEKKSFSVEGPRKNALRFGRARFKNEISSVIRRQWALKKGVG